VGQSLTLWGDTSLYNDRFPRPTGETSILGSSSPGALPWARI